MLAFGKLDALWQPTALLAVPSRSCADLVKAQGVSPDGLLKT